MEPDKTTSLIDTIQSYAIAAWKWMCTTEAANLGSLLSGIGTLLFLLVAFKWVSQKRAEKKSEIAEYALNNLYGFLDEIKTWLKFADSHFVFSRHSPGNTAKLAVLSEKEQKEFIERLNNDKHEVHNYCKSGTDVVKILHEIVYRAKRLSDSQIDEKLKELVQHASELPNRLFDMHFLPNSPESKEKAKEYISNAPVRIEKDCSSVHDLLIDYLMFRKKRKTTP
jgi:hypothetical protein